MLTLNNLLEEHTEIRKVTVSMLMAFILDCNQLHIKIGKEKRYLGKEPKGSGQRESPVIESQGHLLLLPVIRYGEIRGVPAWEAHPSRLHSQQEAISARSLESPGSF